MYDNVYNLHLIGKQVMHGWQIACKFNWTYNKLYDVFHRWLNNRSNEGCKSFISTAQDSLKTV
jgi:predicted phosphoadenosine phosphosulfate sulfurtransferase